MLGTVILISAGGLSVLRYAARPRVPGLEEARDLGHRVAVCSKIVKAGLQSFDPSQYHESWDFNREKIPDLRDAQKRMKEIEKELNIKYT